MSYIRRIRVPSVSTGRSTFLPFNEDSTRDERQAAETDPLKSDSRTDEEGRGAFYVQHFHLNVKICVKMKYMVNICSWPCWVPGSSPAEQIPAPVCSSDGSIPC